MTGPQPGPLALALGLEVLVGLAVLLMSPRFGATVEDEGRPTPEVRHEPLSTLSTGSRGQTAFDRDAHATGPVATVSAPGTGIADDVWPRSYGGPDQTGRPASTPESDDDVRARIRDAWAQSGRDDDGRG